jgi:hypothetical protein
MGKPDVRRLAPVDEWKQTQPEAIGDDPEISRGRRKGREDVGDALVTQKSWNDQAASTKAFALSGFEEERDSLGGADPVGGRGRVGTERQKGDLFNRDSVAALQGFLDPLVGELGRLAQPTDPYS